MKRGFRYTGRVCMAGKNCGGEGRPWVWRHAAAFTFEPGDKTQKRVVRLLLGGELVEAAYGGQRDEESVFPFEVDFSATLAVVGFLAFERAQVFV